jgi:AcrR family transcriptional regulator
VIDADRPAPASRKRVRDPAAKRSAIIEAAAEVFSERGYTGTTIREVARRAGVVHGSVMLHFGSKEQLFLAAVPGTRDLSLNVAGDLDSLPERIAHGFVTRLETAEGTDPFIALVRSAGTDREAADQLLEAMQAWSADIYRTVLDVPDIDERVAMLGALLLGATLSRYVLGQSPLADLSAEDFTDRLATVLRAALFP